MYCAGCRRYIFLVYSGLGKCIDCCWAELDRIAQQRPGEGLDFQHHMGWLVALCFAAWLRAGIYTGARYEMQARLVHTVDLSAQSISPRVFRNEAQLPTTGTKAIP